jgi:FdhE protein
MQGTAARLRSEHDARVTALKRRDPGWQAWLELLQITWRAAENREWADPVVDAETVRSADAAGVPLLHGHAVRVNTRQVQRLVKQLVKPLPGVAYRPTEERVRTLVTAALRQDGAAIDDLAHSEIVEPSTLRTVAQLAVWPLLQASRQQMRERIPVDWQRGYCPMCGAWPLVAELRGLERFRWLRCGRCAADWSLPWLSCAFCGEQRHEELGSLVPQSNIPGPSVNTCNTCRGYLKTFSTLVPITPFDLLLTDLETVELDLIARDRGWLRPERPGYAIDVHITAVGAA